MKSTQYCNLDECTKKELFCTRGQQCLCCSQHPRSKTCKSNYTKALMAFNREKLKFIQQEGLSVESQPPAFPSEQVWTDPGGGVAKWTRLHRSAVFTSCEQTDRLADRQTRLKTLPSLAECNNVVIMVVVLFSFIQHSVHFDCIFFELEVGSKREPHSAHLSISWYFTCNRKQFYFLLRHLELSCKKGKHVKRGCLLQ